MILLNSAQEQEAIEDAAGLDDIGGVNTPGQEPVAAEVEIDQGGEDEPAVVPEV